MTETEEHAYMQGQRAAHIAMIRHCLRELGSGDDLADARSGLQLAETEQALRGLCRDLEIPWDDVRLADIVERCRRVVSVLKERCRSG